MRTRFLDRVVDALGGAKAAADLLGISREAIYMWNRVPVEHVLTIETVTGIPWQELRPDIYKAAQRKPRKRAA